MSPVLTVPVSAHFPTRLAPATLARLRRQEPAAWSAWCDALGYALAASETLEVVVDLTAPAPTPAEVERSLAAALAGSQGADCVREKRWSAVRLGWAAPGVAFALGFVACALLWGLAKALEALS